MTIGFIYTGSTYATPDKGINRTITPKTFTANFGDGYEQRVADGINSIKETYALSFATRPKAEIDDIVAFLDTKAGVTAFTLVLPDTNNTTRSGEEDVKVVCRSHNVVYNYDNFYTLNVQLEKVFEP